MLLILHPERTYPESGCSYQLASLVLHKSPAPGHWVAAGVVAHRLAAVAAPASAAPEAACHCGPSASPVPEAANRAWPALEEDRLCCLPRNCESRAGRAR